jgi:hypothetical protein
MHVIVRALLLPWIVTFAASVIGSTGASRSLTNSFSSIAVSREGYIRAEEFAVRTNSNFDATLRALWGPNEAVCCNGTYFIHVFKSAGSFISDEIQNLCPPSEFKFFANYRAANRLNMNQLWHALNRSDPYDRRLVISLVRDPVDHLVSALHELVARNKISASTSLSVLLDNIERRGFWEPHIYPQWLQLVDQKSGSALPIDYIGRSEQAEDVKRLINRVLPQHRHTSMFRKHDWRVQSRASTQRKNRFSIWPSWNETIRVCAMYIKDYELFNLPMPRACRKGAVKPSGPYMRTE